MLQTAGDETVMVIDDERQILDLFEKILSRKGYNVVTYTDPVQALEHVAEQPDMFQLVITDMSMPDITGEVVIRTLHKRFPSLPVILCTGFTELLSSEEAFEMGVGAYLMKPVSSKELLKNVRKLLDG